MSKRELDQLLNNCWASKTYGDESMTDKEMKEHLRKVALNWKNLTVINIENFPRVANKVTQHFFVNARHDLGVDFDMEQRGISVNTQDKKILNKIVRRLKKIEGIVVTKIETILNKKAA